MTQLLESLPLWLWFLLVLVALFVARKPVHRGIFALARSFHHILRLGATAVAAAEQRLCQRNREVMLAAGRESVERHLEREFTRVQATMKKELSQYPVLHRKLCEQLAAIDEDYVKSAEVPPEPTNWAKAIKAVAEIPANGDGVVADVLETIHHSMRKAEAKALEAYRESARERHQLLRRMMPNWRSMLTTLGRVNKNVDSVVRRARDIDRHMERYEEVQKGSDRALRSLRSSSINRFLFSTVALAVAVGAAAINFTLIASSMTGVVGGGQLGGFAVADAASLVLILLQVAMGLFLMESLGVTRLFPAIGTLDDRLRRQMMWAAAGLLLFLASLEAGLAFTREPFLDMTGKGTLGGADQAGAAWIISAVQVGLGFILPLALTFAAIPLESFVASARAVVGLFASFLLRALAVTLRLLGSAASRSASLLVHLYDIVIFLPLWLEDRYFLWRSEVADRATAAEKG